MPTDLIHRIGIRAPAETIYRALTTEDGIRAWWTTDVKMDACAGGKAVFGFFDHSTVFEMRIQQLTPSSLVRLTANRRGRWRRAKASGCSRASGWCP